MLVKPNKQSLPDSYFRLVKQFPLTHIRNDKQLDTAAKMIDGLLQKDLDEGAQEYLDALTDLVEAYERDHHSMPDVSEADILRELMRSNGLTQSRLAKHVAISQSTLSAVLSGARTLTKEQVLRLARSFRVSPSAFLPA
jgi:HTH-type transcriptional regulator/antitoxin HigA